MSMLNLLELAAGRGAANPHGWWWILAIVVVAIVTPLAFLAGRNGGKPREQGPPRPTRRGFPVRQ